MSKVITGEDTRFSFVNVWQPRASMDGGAAQYSISLIIPKTDVATVDAVRKALREAYTEGLDKLKGSSKSTPAFESIRTPLRDGDIDRPDDAVYRDSYFINAKSYSQPGVVDANCNDITEADKHKLYSGCYGRASIGFQAYHHSGNKGISAYINNLQVLRDGEPLGGKASAKSDFGQFAPKNSAVDDFLN